MPTSSEDRSSISESPLQKDSPWPVFRKDFQNTGNSPLKAVYQDNQPWFFQTGKGIFSTPVVDSGGKIYIGSADHFFYVLEPDGSLAWKFQTGGVIDSAAALCAPSTEFNIPASVTFLSGDGLMYRLSIKNDDMSNQARVLWTFEAEKRSESFNNWWEGNVAIGEDETIYAGNTNFLYYAISPNGESKWTLPTGSNNWSMAAFSSEGNIYWGSNDTFIRAISPHGKQLWRRRTLGFIAASAAVGSDGTVYIGSFDSRFYALDPASGRVKWKFSTEDHIYSSAALGKNHLNETSAIYFGSTDGCMYALNPEGTLLWRFNAGAPIRSSPVVGRSSDDKDIVYFGCGNGMLYALDAENGLLRWTYNTTPNDPILCDRNDLNGSPALNDAGIIIAGEHGQVWFIPYDYPLYHPEDPRCRENIAPQPRNFRGVLPVTPGGTVQPEFPEEVSPATIFVLRLIVDQEGEVIAARVCNNPIYCPSDALKIVIDPYFPHTVEHSADGKYIYILPKDILPPGTKYSLHICGNYYAGGLKIGNLNLGGKKIGRFENRFTFITEDNCSAWFPLGMSPDKVSAIEWTRLSAVLPTMLPSLNQIGFDAIEWIISTALLSPPDSSGKGRCVLWAVDGQRDETGLLLPNPDGDVTLPLSGTYQGNSFIVSSENFSLPITGITIPFNHFELRGRLNSDLSIQPGAIAYAETQVLSIPNFGPKMVIAGLASEWFRKMLVIGSYMTKTYPDYGHVNHAPEGIRINQLLFKPATWLSGGKLEANFELSPGVHFPKNKHRAGILLIDPQSITAISMDYHSNLTIRADSHGDLQSACLDLPRGLRLPNRFLVIVMLDVFPIHREFLYLP